VSTEGSRERDRWEAEDVRRNEQAVNIWCERFRHLGTSDIRDSVQCKAVRRLVHLIEVLANRVDNETNDVRVLVHQEGEGEVTLCERTGQRESSKA
jgi:hypothetical protein